MFNCDDKSTIAIFNVKTIKDITEFPELMLMESNYISDNVDENNRDILSEETSFHCNADNEYQCATHLCNYKKNHTVKTPVCDLCSKSFSSNQKLKQHMMIHTNTKPFNCKICMKSFRQKYNLNSHMISHSKDKLFQCEKCSKWFSRKGNLVSHILTHSRQKPIKVLDKKVLKIPSKCIICDTIFTKPFTLKRHMLLHIGKRPFYCEICKRSFSQKWNFDVHMRVHTKEKPFQCDICGKYFSIKQKMKQHIITHFRQKCSQYKVSNEVFSRKMLNKPHKKHDISKCSLCNTIFTTSYALRRHMFLHTGKSPFYCEICMKSFSQKWNFDVHMRVHTGEKPFQCDICSKYFSIKQKMKQHKINLHNPEKL